MTSSSTCWSASMTRRLLPEQAASARRRRVDAETRRGPRISSDLRQCVAMLEQRAAESGQRGSSKQVRQRISRDLASCRRPTTNRPFRAARRNWPRRLRRRLSCSRREARARRGYQSSAPRSARVGRHAAAIPPRSPGCRQHGPSKSRANLRSRRRWSRFAISRRPTSMALRWPCGCAGGTTPSTRAKRRRSVAALADALEQAHARGVDPSRHQAGQRAAAAN